MSRYRCDECGFTSHKWMGFCPRCRSGSLRQVAPTTNASAPLPLTAVAAEVAERISSGCDEVDRVLGGGLVGGAVTLLAGEPGIGKSTLLLQVAAAVGRERPVLYVTAEESPTRVGARARRLGLTAGGVAVLGSASVDDVVAEVRSAPPRLLVVDSVQAVTVAEASGAAGGVTQVREAATRLAALARETETATVLVGHVTKDGAVAGPKLLEHVVDVVCHLEGDARRDLRFLRASKNRYGSIDEIGLFTMAEGGMRPVTDPAEALLAGRDPLAPGSILFPAVEGRRTLLVEIQALVAPAGDRQPRRSAKGIPVQRLHQVLAVLDRHAGVGVAALDVYVAVSGGLRIVDPAVDLPVALAVASSVLGVPLGPTAAWGEVGLTGEIRADAHGARRLAEAERVRCDRVLAPEREARRIDAAVAAVARRLRVAAP